MWTRVSWVIVLVVPALGQESLSAIREGLGAAGAPSEREILSELGAAPTVEQALAEEGEVEGGVTELVREARRRRAGGEVEAALESWSEVERLCESGLGNEHWRTRAARAEVASLRFVLELEEEDREALLAAWAVTEECEALDRAGQHGAAIDRAWEAYELRAGMRPEDALEQSAALAIVAWTLSDAGQRELCDGVARWAWKVARAAVEPPHPTLTSLALLLGRQAMEEGRLRAGEAFVLWSLRDARRVGGVEDSAAALALSHCIGLMDLGGRYDEGERLARDLVARAESLPPDQRVAAYHNLAYLIGRQGKVDEARPWFDATLEQVRELEGERSLAFANTEIEYAALLLLAGDPEAAEQRARHAYELLYEREGLTQALTVRALRNLGVAVVACGHSGAGEDLLRQAIAAATAFGDPVHGELLGAESALAQVLTQRNDLREAEEILRSCLERLRRGPGAQHPSYLPILHNHGFVLRAEGRTAEAERDLLEEQRLLDRPGALPYLRFRGLSQLALLAVQTGALERAHERLEAARALLGEGDLREHIGFAALAGQVHLASGELELAELALREGIELALSTGASQDPSLGLLHSLMASLCERRGDLSAAAGELRIALDLGESLRTEIAGGERELALFSVRQGQLAARLADICLRMGRASEAFEVHERAAGRVLLDLLAQSGFDYASAARGAPAPAAERLRNLVGEEDEAHAARLREEQRQASLAARTDLGEEREAKLAAQAAAVERARVASRAAEARLLAALAGHLPEARLVPLAQLRAALEAGELVLTYLWSSEQASLLVLDGAAIDTPVLALELARGAAEIAALGQRVAAARARLVAPPSTAEERTAARAELRALGERLVPPSVLERIGAARRLVILADGPLAELPYEALGTADDDLLGERVPEVVYAPSLAVYVDRRRAGAARRASEPSALVLSDPSFVEGAARTSASPAAASELERLRRDGLDLVRLPGSQREAAAIAGVLERTGLPVERLAGERATLSAWRAAAPQAAYLHLATHGFAGSSERPLDACLAFAPEPDAAVPASFLTLEELLRHGTGELARSQLVVLSACDGLRTAEIGATPFALSWGFFFAGAPTVIASAWRVDDAATALLMERFYESLFGRHEEVRRVGGSSYEPGQALPKARALLEAKLWLRSAERAVVRERLRARGLAAAAAPPSPTLVPYADPYFWAGFLLVGDPD